MKEIITLLSVFTLVFIAVIAVIYFTEKEVGCPALSEATKRPTKMSFWAGGCFVQLKSGDWVDSNNYKGVVIEEKKK